MTMMRRIGEKFMNFLIFVTYLAKDIRLFRPYNRRLDNPQRSHSPPESRTIQILPTNPKAPTDQPPPRPRATQHSHSPPESQTIQILHQTNPIAPTDQPPPRPGGRRADRDTSTNAADGHMTVMGMEWALLIMGVCFTAVGAALQALQTAKPLPLTFHWFCMLLQLAFIALILSTYIRPLSRQASLVMGHVAIFFCSTAFMLITSINFSAPFLEISLALYFVLVLLLIFAKIFIGWG